MVLENIISPENAENRPGLMMILGAIYASLAMFLSYYIFQAYSSIFMIFLTTLAAAPTVYKIMKTEEEKDLTDMEERVLLKEHAKALKAFMWLFIGATLAFAFWFVVLPEGMSNTLFHSQTSTISSINARVTESIAFDEVTDASGEITGHVSNPAAIFSKIFFNNVKVLLFCILFSFIYGAGAIFILIWNASIVGAAIGAFVSGSIDALTQTACGPNAGTTFCAVTSGIMRYAIHGLPEILAYFIAALAGGIISIAVINHEFTSRKFEHIMLDSADLIMLAIGILFFAALIEVFITPSLSFDRQVYTECISWFKCGLA
ncbi:MAG TPA: stage II sporulation protein M [Alphaproteobacteria bacterium]|nr:stage II sporulation protein M [Alphaproteobacteria bacterium]